jgi:hypothetical protein
MGRSSLEWLCFFIAAAKRGSPPAEHLHISYAQDILAPVYGRFRKGFVTADMSVAARSMSLCWSVELSA